MVEKNKYKEEEEVLGIEEVSTNNLTKVDLIRINEDLHKGMEAAQHTIDQQRKEINKQVEMYNEDIKHIGTIYTNTLQYSRAKEDALLKIMEGTIELLKVDRINIVPEKKEENINGN